MSGPLNAYELREARRWIDSEPWEGARSSGMTDREVEESVEVFFNGDDGSGLAAFQSGRRRDRAEGDGIGVRPFHLGQLDDAPVVSRHQYPQNGPQEWDCGCVTGAYVTDRNALIEGEDPFEMRLAEPCDDPNCEVKKMVRELEPA